MPAAVKYSVLNTRKRAIIALVHTIFFFGVAVVTIHRSTGSRTAMLALGGMYLIVTGALLLLAGYGRAWSERTYFGLCATSAALGLLRLTVHHPAITAAQVLRPAVLLCAAIVLTGIMRAQAD